MPEPESSPMNTAEKLSLTVVASIIIGILYLITGQLGLSTTVMQYTIPFQYIVIGFYVLLIWIVWFIY